MSNSKKGRRHQQHNERTEALLAFRTITTMLSLIQSNANTDSDAGLNVKNSRKELKILNAFATVAIREYGVAAVVAAPYDQSGNIQVLASVSYLNHDEGQLTIPQPSLSNKVTDYLSRFLFNLNPEAPVDSPNPPTIVESGSGVPPHLIRCADKRFELLMTFLTSNW